MGGCKSATAFFSKRTRKGEMLKHFSLSLSVFYYFSVFISDLEELTIEEFHKNVRQSKKGLIYIRPFLHCCILFIPLFTQGDNLFGEFLEVGGSAVTIFFNNGHEPAAGSQ